MNNTPDLCSVSMHSARLREPGKCFSFANFADDNAQILIKPFFAQVLEIFSLLILVDAPGYRVNKLDLT
jgi:hypothetical protein